MALLIATSLLSADFRVLRKELEDVEAAGADLIHADVKDGHFVPNLTIGPMIVKAVRAATSLPIDAHLMIENPDQYVEAFAQAGADIITIHVETGYHLFRTIDMIRSAGKKAGIALNPGTPLSSIEEVLEVIDLILIMTVNPGFGGQNYIASMTEKIGQARQMIAATGRLAARDVRGRACAQRQPWLAHRPPPRRVKRRVPLLVAILALAALAVALAWALLPRQSRVAAAACTIWQICRG